MSPAIEDILPLLVRYFGDDCSPEQRADVERWIAANPDHRRVFDRLHAAWDSVGAYLPDPAVGETLAQSLAAQIAMDAGMRTDHSRRRHLLPRRVPRHAVALAALAVAAVAVGVASFAWQRDSASHVQPVSYQTKIGQTALISLADGSTIRLAPQSRLTVGANFGSQERAVQLSGEAYFTVSSQRAAPFVVHTGLVTTRVLGTAFDVRQYPQDPYVRIAVVEGKVVTSGRAKMTTLTAGMVGRMNDSLANVTTSDDVAAYTRWTHGRLEFVDAPVPEVLATLEHWYGVRFQVADTALNRARLLGSFDFGSQADAINALEVMLGATVTFDRAGDTTIVILHTRRDVPPRRKDTRTSFTDRTEVGR